MTLPYGVVDMAAITSFAVPPGMENVPCPPYPRPRPSAWGPTSAQTAAVSGKCWRTPCSSPATVADHQPPLVAAWVMGGCHMPPATFTTWASSQQAVPRGHCLTHSRSQGAHMSGTFKRGEAVKALARALASLA